ncbi:unnamed protein product [Calypogeia fissa]
MPARRRERRPALSNPRGKPCGQSLSWPRFYAASLAAVRWHKSPSPSSFGRSATLEPFREPYTGSRAPYNWEEEQVSPRRDPARPSAWYPPSIQARTDRNSGHEQMVVILGGVLTDGRDRRSADKFRACVCAYST